MADEQKQVQQYLFSSNKTLDQYECTNIKADENYIFNDTNLEHIAKGNLEEYLGDEQPQKRVMMADKFVEKRDNQRAKYYAILVYDEKYVFGIKLYWDGNDRWKNLIFFLPEDVHKKEKLTTTLTAKTLLFPNMVYWLLRDNIPSSRPIYTYVLKRAKVLQNAVLSEDDLNLLDSTIKDSLTDAASPQALQAYQILAQACSKLLGFVTAPQFGSYTSSNWGLQYVVKQTYDYRESRFLIKWTKLDVHITVANREQQQFNWVKQLADQQQTSYALFGMYKLMFPHTVTDETLKMIKRDFEVSGGLDGSKISTAEAQEADYYQCDPNTDNGFWHELALDMCRYGNIDQNKFTNFVHTITKRVFAIAYNLDQVRVSYNFQQKNHVLAVDEYCHVIVRIESGKPLIFVCVRKDENKPEECTECTQEEALGLLKTEQIEDNSGTHTQTEYDVRRQGSGSYRSRRGSSSELHEDDRNLRRVLGWQAADGRRENDLRRADPKGVYRKKVEAQQREAAAALARRGKNPFD